MVGDNDKVVGYFGYLSIFEVVCKGNACIIAGSEAAFRKYLMIANLPHSGKIIIKKTWFSEVLRGLSLGAAYSFDEKAYGKFYPLARKASLDIPNAEFNDNPGKEIDFVTVRINGRS